MVRESEIQTDVRLEFSRMRAGILLRYQVGTFIAPQNGAYVKIGEPGVSDLIGGIQHTITEADVGKTVLVFSAIEMKQIKESTDPERKKKQRAFMERVNALGGLAGIVRSVDQMKDLVLNKWNSKVRKDFC